MKTLPIVVGSYVRSYDFQDNTSCFVEGEVTGLGVGPGGYHTYEIKVERQVFGGRETVGSRSLVGHCVYPPLNGTPGLFGKAQGVLPMLRLTTLPGGALSSQYEFELGKRYAIREVDGSLYMVLFDDGSSTSIHQSRFEEA